MTNSNVECRNRCMEDQEWEWKKGKNRNRGDKVEQEDETSEKALEKKSQSERNEKEIGEVWVYKNTEIIGRQKRQG